MIVPRSFEKLEPQILDSANIDWALKVSALPEVQKGEAPISIATSLLSILLFTLVLFVAAVVIALLVPRLISDVRLRNRAQHDYRVARGTQHLKQLKDPLSRLERDIQATRQEIRTVKRRLSDLADKRERDLKEALSRYLVTRRLTEVDGIGPRLRDRIIRHSFRGKLQDLHHAERVSGVGPTRQNAIMRWVRAREREFPALMKASFPRKEEITAEYEAKTASLERKLNRARKALEEKEALHESVSAAVNKLRSVHMSHFKKALRQSTSDQPVPNWYIEGVFPAWESAPDWFVTLLKEYGG
jgi:hypothetical protein